MNKPIQEVAIAMIVKEGRTLITRREDATHMGGLWEFPGGKRLPGETFEECLIREVLEELDVHIKIERPLGRIEHPYPDRIIILQGYLCSLQSGNPKALSAQELQWVLPATLPAYPFPEANRPFLARLIEGIPGNRIKE
ncbi:MAG: (deoxy)nucleoside triphosphate pyrophosphohydrolase [Nitrospiria bacterium]